MSSIVRKWRNWTNKRKFTKVGKGCRFTGKNLMVKGHVELGDFCRFRDNVILRTDGEGKITFGDRSGCSWYCIIEATTHVKIGKFTGIAEFTVIRDTNHFVFGTDDHWRVTPYVAEPITIGDSVLVGSRCYIGPGITIGDGAVIAPGSIVTKDIGPYEIWAGSPARFVAHRTKNVPDRMLKRYEELLRQYGLKEDRYNYTDEDIKAAARQAGVEGKVED
ncbi:MAG: acyltransferase [Candidatus Hydrogenedentes bacterium]|nr:acyltransferase [Candidatus Hydrogenedentota bacterium]